MNNKIKCPYCGDEWEYKFIIDHENGKAVVTKDFHVLEEGQECICYKCFGHYKLILDKATNRMFDFVYRSWRNVRGK